MSLSSLLLCRDPESLRVLRRVFEDIGVSLEVFTGPDPAVEALAKKKYDAVLIDCDDMHGATGVLKLVRTSPSNRSAIVFAIVNRVTNVRDAFTMGANFVLDKPLAMERVARSLKAAQGLIERERRRYFRQQIRLKAEVMLPGGENAQAWVSNLSTGGISLVLAKSGPTSGSVRVRFSLPEGKQLIDAQGEIAWTGQEGGQMGVRFLQVPAAAQKELDRWLSTHLEKQPARMPLFINASREPGKAGR
ncbi:MAG TPA: response regulator [Terriglobales bacterium]|jgi:CheY-like chemotaxis protein|nr:response regulator [Terriglobales bacterium]